jgi:hypothetical protein
MEEKIKAWPFMIGPSFQKDGSQIYVGLGFYWFKIAFFWKWHLHTTKDCQLSACPWTGFMLAYRPAYSPKEGDLLWAKTKKWFLRG